MLVELCCSLGGSSQMTHSLSCRHPGCLGCAVWGCCTVLTWAQWSGKQGRAPLGTAERRDLVFLEMSVLLGVASG